MTFRLIPCPRPGCTKQHGVEVVRASSARALPEFGEASVARFWSHVDRRGPDECWEWTASRNPTGYGHFWEGGRGGRELKAHRVALALSGVAIATGDQVLHNCDNPPCCNPAHLRTGTQADNMADMAAKGRSIRGRRFGPRASGSVPHRARLTAGFAAIPVGAFSGDEASSRDLDEGSLGTSRRAPGTPAPAQAGSARET